MIEIPKKVTKVHCNRCGHETSHDVIAIREQTDSINLGDLGESTRVLIFEMLECRGCQDVRLRRTLTLPEDEYEDISYYPPSVSRRFPVWKRHLPYNLQKLVTEIYGALHANSCVLAIMGVRALIDIAILSEVGDQGTFTSGVNALQKKGLVSSRNAEFLTSAFDAGSAAAHRGYQPKTADVNTAMDIAENLLQAIYVLGPAAAKLKESTPPRPFSTEKVGRVL